jgi:hypothetical protein
MASQVVLLGETWCVEWRGLVEKLLSGGSIKVTQGAWRVLKWRVFMASQVVLLGETW